MCNDKNGANPDIFCMQIFFIGGNIVLFSDFQV